MELKPNMYVRTKAGMISKIISKEDVSGSLHREEIVFILDNGNKLALHSHKVIKASHNIIDLIEVGDYVNGCRVEEHAHEKGRLFVTYTYIGGKGFTTYEDYSWELAKDREEDIKSIVTKEQFESMEYKVGD